MDLQDLYWRIVEMLEDTSDPWVRETLKWWNKQCNPTNGSGSSMSKKAKDDAASSEDDMAQVRARRAGATVTSESMATKNKTPGSAKARPGVETMVKSIGLSDSGAPSRNEPAKENEAALHMARASIVNPKQTKHKVACERPSMCRKEDTDLPKASSRNEQKEKEAPRALPAKPNRTENGVVRHKKSSMHDQLDKSKSSASASATRINEDDGSDYDNRDSDVDTHSIQWDPDVGETMQVDATDRHAAAQYSPAGSPLSQLPDDVDDETTLVDMQGSCVGSNLAKRVKFTFSAAAAATKDNADTPPQKKAKKASTRPQTAPPKRNPARGKRANGF